MCPHDIATTLQQHSMIDKREDRSVNIIYILKMLRQNTYSANETLVITNDC